MSGMIIERENLRGREGRRRSARLAQRSLCFFSRPGACMSPSFQPPVTCLQSLFARLLIVSSARRLARCRSMPTMPWGSSFRALPALFVVCVGCSLYARRLAPIERLVRTLKASELNQLMHLKKWLLSVSMAMLMVILMGVYSSR